MAVTIANVGNEPVDANIENHYRSLMQTATATKKASSSASLTHETPRIPVESLLGTGRQVVIVHAGREYRLRLTQNGKLILTA